MRERRCEIYAATLSGRSTGESSDIVSDSGRDMHEWRPQWNRCYGSQRNTPKKANFLFHYVSAAAEFFFKFDERNRKKYSNSELWFFLRFQVFVPDGPRRFQLRPALCNRPYGFLCIFSFILFRWNHICVRSRLTAPSASLHKPARQSESCCSYEAENAQRGDTNTSLPRSAAGNDLIRMEDKKKNRLQFQMRSCVSPSSIALLSKTKLRFAIVRARNQQLWHHLAVTSQ